MRDENKQLSYQISNVSILQRENQDLKQRVGETDNYKRTITEYENKLALLSSEIERLKQMNNEGNQLRDQNNFLRQENDRLKREISGV